MKHVERHHFFVRECVENHQIRVPFVKSVDNIGDFFTKAQPDDLFLRMRDIIMNHDASVTGGRSDSHGGSDIVTDGHGNSTQLLSL